MEIWQKNPTKQMKRSLQCDIIWSVKQGRYGDRCFPDFCHALLFLLKDETV